MATRPEGRTNPAPYWVIILGGALTAIIGYGLSAGWLFPSAIEDKVAIEMLRDIIQVDGVLIGFVGLIVIFAMGELTKAFELMDQSMERLQSFGENKRREALGAVFRGLNRLLDRRWIVGLTVGLTIALFAASILSSLVSMSKIGGDTYATPQGFIVPLCAMISGVVGIFLVFVFALMQARP